MITVINMKCQNCGSDYFLSAAKNSAMKKCANCEVLLSLPRASAFMVLSNKFEERIFYENYKELSSAELRQHIHIQGQIYRQSVEQEKIELKREDEERFKKYNVEKQKEKESKINELHTVLESDYYNAKVYWENNLMDWLTKQDLTHELAQFVIRWFKQRNLPEPDFEQAQAISNVWDNVQVIARAGSGKTSTIINRTYFLIKHCAVNPNEILILAFNKKAAREVNDRLEKLLGNQTPQAMTFHALAYAIVHPEENLIYDEVEKLQKSKSVQRVIDSYIRNEDYSTIIKKFMMKYFKEDWDRIVERGFNLSKEQLVDFRRNLPYIGFDGRYYKSMGEKRIADYLFERDIPYYYERNFWWGEINYRPDFTIIKNNEYSKGIVIEYFGMQGDQYYDLNTYQKIKFWKNKTDYEFVELYPKDVESNSLDQYLLPILSEYFTDIERISEDELWNRLKDRAIDEFSAICKTFIEKSRKLMFTPEDVKNLVYESDITELEEDFIKIVATIYDGYLEYLYHYEEEDFDGLLYRAISEIDNGEVAWDRKDGAGNLKHIKHLFIDEFQDFSLLFHNLIEAVRRKNTQVKLFCVGDDWQAINGFAGSDLKFFKQFEANFDSSFRLNISTNYRSLKNIVETGNTLMQDEGLPSKSIKKEEGEVFYADLQSFVPSVQEKSKYSNDLITPALIRIVKSFIDNDQKVVLLGRRRKGLPWYTNIENRYKDFRENLANKIREEFSEDKRDMIRAVETTHSFKGREEEGIIIMDAVERSYPLLHPRNVFYQVLGQTLDKVYEEEKRLFYVALTRAKSRLVIMTDSTKKSPFLSNILKRDIMKPLDINSLNYPVKNRGSLLTITVSNKVGTRGTIAIKEMLKSSQYSYDPSKMCWYKSVGTQYFDEQKLLNENWIKKANNVVVKVKDEFDTLYLGCMVMSGQVIKHKTRNG